MHKDIPSSNNIQRVTQTVYNDKICTRRYIPVQEVAANDGVLVTCCEHSSGEGVEEGNDATVVSQMHFARYFLLPCYCVP
jgi:hypothetical protein